MWNSKFLYIYMFHIYAIYLNIIIFKTRKGILCLILILITESLLAQMTTDIYGEILDELGEPLVEASVFLEGTQPGVQTDFDGNYTKAGVALGIYLLPPYVY